MVYNYERERPKLFTEDGQVVFLRVRDNVKALLKEAGAFRAQEAWSGTSGDSWLFAACLDRLVELGEIKELTAPGSVWGQHRVFVSVHP